MSLTVVAVILCLSAAIQLGYFLFLFQPALRSIEGIKKTSPSIKDKPPVSLIICAFNEAINLKSNLPPILSQDYPDFEVIVVNDRSSDDTASILRNYSQDYPGLRVVTIDPKEKRDFPGKKFALSRGVAAAQNELLLLTDADCMPAGKHWISAMVQPLLKGKDMAAAFGDFYAKKGWLNSFIRSETLHTFLQLLSYQHAGMPYMAVGRNLMCRKALLEKAQVHPLWKATPSGDDDMLIRLGATKENMAVVTTPESVTYSPAKENFKSYVRQKQRHLSTGKLYRKPVQFLLGMYAISHTSFWMSAILMVIFWSKTGFENPWAVAAFFAFILRNGVFYSSMKMLQQQLRRKKDRQRFFVYFDFMWLGYNFAFSPYILWKTKQDWH